VFKKPALDPLTLGVIRGVVEQALNEVLTTFGRLAFSPVITEGHDYGVGLYARETGELLMVDKEAFPLFVWLGQDAVRAVVAATSVDAFNPGDVFLLNDPYLTGTHMHDVKAVAPVIWRDELICFLCVTGHWADIGGPSPGGFATNATEIYQEGLRIPPVRIMSEGELDQGLVSLIMNNVRIPETTIGDLFAQISSVRLGQERMQDILERFGAETFLTAMALVGDTGEAQMRERIGGIPDGTYHYRDCLDNDGITFDPVWIDCVATVVRSDITLDFSNSDPPVRGAFNAPPLTTVAASNIAMHHAFPDVLLTGGSARPIKVVVGPEVFIGAEFPRACEAYGEVSSRIMDTVLGALWQALPERAQGGIFGTSSNLSIGGTDPGRGPYIMYAYLGGGQGGNWSADGLNNGPTAIGVALTPQIENYEHAYPVRYREFSLREDSGGLGKFRGGLGVVWDVEIIRGDATMSAMADRASRGAAGLMGGRPGAPNVYQVIRADGAMETLPHLTKCENFPLKAGDRIRRHSPGGGGLGSVLERESSLREADLQEGYVSEAAYREAEEARDDALSSAPSR
jgi:N-methylhydantoinase B